MSNSNHGLHISTGSTSGHADSCPPVKSKRQSLEIKLRYNNEEHKYEVIDSPCPTKYDTATQEYQMKLPSGKILVVKQSSSRRNSDTGSIVNQFTGLDDNDVESLPPTPVKQAKPPTPTPSKNIKS